ncbi:choice-of-anchor E domain-containing protein [Glaciecola sp. XM2]|jgi:hypothetical protein|uniref:choice-of-anchor E domain-containing protein n=1 Tax=Glaciecola sp. XM2 TaxID=1914931 RepID=UPI001BDEB104|nr:choice-of-anchor E domain-containing protein [Glaciecola sp. XM2]MBT1452430.1 choice-of-anchor E domain-containing protein [Glaciecola sp. XM2]
MKIQNKNATLAIMLLGSLLFIDDASASLITSSQNFSTGTNSVSVGYQTTPRFNDREIYAQNTFAGFDSSIGILESVKISYDTTASVEGWLDIYDPSTGFFAEDNVSGDGYAAARHSIDLLSPNLGSSPANFASEYLRCSDGDGNCTDFGSNTRYLDGILLNITNGSLLQGFIDTSIVLRSTNYASARISRCDDDEDLCRVRSTSEFSGRYTLEFTYSDFPVAASSPAAFGLFIIGLVTLVMRRKYTKN